MNFIETIMQVIFNLGDFIGSLLGGLVEFLTLPLALLLSLLEGIFHFINVLFQIVVMILSIFVGLFQFIFSISGALFRTVFSWVGFAPSGSVNLPSASRHGFETVLDQVGGTGLLTVIPNVLIAVIWLLFAYKIIGLIGGSDNKGSGKKP